MADSRTIRWMGLLPLSFFLLHGLYYLRHGGLGHMLWMCNLSNLLLALGLLFNRPMLIRIAVCWLLPGLLIWWWFIVMQGGWLLTSTIAHVGGLLVGLWALLQVRADRRTWRYAFLWFLAVQQVCRLVTPAALNVNIAHQVFVGWEGVFPAYWPFWLATTLVAGVGLWLLGFVLLRLVPPRMSRL